jgi:hypothetical protein
MVPLDAASQKEGYRGWVVLVRIQQTVVLTLGAEYR